MKKLGICLLVCLMFICSVAYGQLTAPGRRDFHKNLVTNEAPWTDVRWYGADDGDGTDDTTAIQNAINAAKTTTGKVYFPAMYATNAALVVDSSVELIGSGWNSGITNSNASAANAIELIVSGATEKDIVIRHLKIVGNVSSGDGIHIEGDATYAITNVQIEDVWVTGHGGDGIELKYINKGYVKSSFVEQNGANGIRLSNGYGVDVKGNNIDSHTSGAHIYNINCAESSIEDNKITGACTDAIYLQSQGGSVDNNYISVTATGDLIDINSSYVSIAGNYLFGTPGSGYVIFDDSGTTSNIVIASNYSNFSPSGGQSHLKTDNGGDYILLQNNSAAGAWTVDATSGEAIVMRNNTLSGVGQIVTTISTLPVNDTTPSVSGKRIMDSANTSTTVISDLDDGTEGQILTLIIKDTYTTFQYSSNLNLSDKIDWTPQVNDTITFVYDGTDWYELNRSLNG